MREIKEKLCYIGLDLLHKHTSPAQVDKEKTYALPDAPNVSVARKCCSSHTVLIHDGSALHHAILRLAGRGLTVSSTRSSPSKGTLHRHQKEGKTGELPNGNINVAPNFPVVRMVIPARFHWLADSTDTSYRNIPSVTQTSAVLARHVVLSRCRTIHREVLRGPPQEFYCHHALTRSHLLTSRL